MRIHVGFCIALLGIGVGCGGGGEGDDGGGPDAGVSAKCAEATEHDDLAWIQQNIFSASCTFSACHKGTATDADNLNLETGMSHAELVNRESSELSGMMRVTPGDPSQSYLLIAIGHVDGQLPTDGRMPLNSVPLCVEKREAIERWIAAGAQP